MQKQSLENMKCFLGFGEAQFVQLGIGTVRLGKVCIWNMMALLGIFSSMASLCSRSWISTTAEDFI